MSRELEIVLTSRSKGGNSRIPLAGVPYHAAEGYIAKLVQKGYNVAVCDQLEDAKNVKGIVRRDVVRVITPGTAIDPSIISSTGARYLMAVCPGAGKGDWGLAFLDISTGEFFVSGISAGNPLQELLSEIARYHPAECIVPSCIPEEIITAIKNLAVAVNPYRDDAFEEQNARSILAQQFRVSSFAGYGCEDIPAALGAAGAARRYAQETQNSRLPHISG
ncbi:MAG: DNA mismatch repair protein MutS, partial [Methanoregula sp.]|nr:DNA mismatch repair protein MutS [Methanoregula sp.]